LSAGIRTSSGTRLGHALYVIAWDQRAKSVRAFKVERISGAQLRDETFSPPPGFSIAKHLASAWAIWSSTEPIEVELLFSTPAAARVQETIWHPSQRLETTPDGRMRLRFTVGAWLEIRHWVLGWGEDCEVVAPDELRKSIRQAADGMSRIYGGG
jgi:predicted DNA-binding transcriptional regulator YafY